MNKDSNSIKLKNDDLTKVNGGSVKLGGESNNYKYKRDDCFQRFIESSSCYMYLKIDARNFNSTVTSYHCYKWEPNTITIDGVQYTKSNRTTIDESELDNFYTKIESLPTLINQ